MRWFVALNEVAYRADRYIDLLKVAVSTAAQRTSLVPHLLYDGQPNSWTRWLRGRGVQIIPCRSFAYDELRAIARRRDDPHILSIGAGALLRIEIPRIVRDLRMDDEFVFYTDVDVMFMEDVCARLELMTPRLFAAGPEFDRDDPVRMNSGVMLMNVGALAKLDDDFRSFVVAHLEELIDQSWDQGAYRRYFGRSAVMTKIRGTEWDALPPELNWKPYWGNNDRAAIVHFHGPKPQDSEMFRCGTVDRQQQWMTSLTGAGYHAYTDAWRCVLAAVDEESTG